MFVRAGFCIAMLSVSVASATACDIAGTWSGPAVFIGRMADRGTRTLTVNIAADCSYNWMVQGVTQTNGRASAGWSACSYSYRNEAGSIGTMTVSGRNMDIVQTQGDYTAKLTRRGR